MNEKDIFVEAFEIADPAEREDFLSQASGGDADLRGRVNALLEAYYTASSFLGSPAASVEALTIDLDPPGPLEGPGTLIGPYKLLQSLGEGGMGAVYMAEQEHPVKRRVALKIIKAGLDTKQVIARFEQERQALALMDHPNIARVLDAGTTAAGRPYFVMELVKGIPLTKLCDRERLSPRERLELFIPVCHAVQHAHQKGIIHRDLKPSNVLVALYDGHPVPKVIDFGVAKATTQKLTQRTMFTEVGSIIGTLEYMAPEQAELNNLDIDTRADIYSLGVILYELLTGSPPFTAAELRSAAFSEMLRMIREVEPPKPSTRLSSAADLPSIAALRKLEPARLESVVSGELDWIVMKCLDKDRGRRYEAANGLAADIERYLRDEPVLASPASRSYRLRRLARKNRKWIATGAAFAAILALGAIVSSVLAVKAREAEKSAEEEEKSARANFELASQAVDKYLNVLAEDPELERADLTALKKRLLETAIPFYEDLARKQPQSPTAALERGKALLRLSQVRQQVGDVDADLRDLKPALEIFKELAKAHPEDDEVQSSLALGYDHQAYVLELLGQLNLAREAAGQALAIQERRALEQPENLKLARRLAAYIYRLSTINWKLGDASAAEGQLRRALDLHQRLADRQPDAPDLLRDVARVRCDLAQHISDRGQLKEAVVELSKATAAAAVASRLLPNDHSSKSLEARGHELLADTFNKLQDAASAEKEYRLSLEAREELVKRYPSRPHYRADLATSRANFGALLSDYHRFEEAERLMLQAIAEADQVQEYSPGVLFFGQVAAAPRMNLGLLLRKLGRNDESERFLREAVALCEKIQAGSPSAPEPRMDFAMALTMLGGTLGLQKKVKEAVQSFNESVNVLRSLVEEFPSVEAYRQRLAEAMQNLAIALKSARDYEEALKVSRECEEIARKLVADFPANPMHRKSLGALYDSTAVLLQSMRRWGDSMASFEQCMALQAQLSQEFPGRPEYVIDLGRTYSDIGIMLREQGETDRCLEWLQKASRTLEAPIASHPKDYALKRALRNTLMQSASVLTLRGRNTEAAEAWKETEKLALDPVDVARFAHGRALTLALGENRPDDALTASRMARAPQDLKDAALYDMGCYCALAASSRQAQDPVRDKLAAEAVECLREAVRRGFRRTEHMKNDEDLISLRARDDFKALLGELESMGDKSGS